ncbi:MAG: ATPase P [Deltaproteobacteria bacterium]|nr:ATPase P [Deltaproteobacteria bacterium]
MMEIPVPGKGPIILHHLVADFNGTLATDGKLLPGVMDRLDALADDLAIHIVTADTHGTVAETFSGTSHKVVIIPADNQDQAKLDYIRDLGPDRVAAVGNGRNDLLMLREASLSIAVVGAEGAFVDALGGAQIASASITDALDLLLHPLRLTATLRV